jgi:hypothetical protein
MGSFDRNGAAWATIACVCLLLAGPLGAQSSSPAGFDVGLAVGRFADYPSDFSPRYCEQDAGGATGKLGYRLSALFTLEATATASKGVGESMCFIPSPPEPRDGDVFARPVLDDEILGQSFFATHLAAMVEPLPARVLSPRIRIGVGRLWDKKLNNWFYGGGVRIRFGSNAIVADVERWNLKYDLRRELLIHRDSGAHELQSVEVIRQSPKPYLFRIGWERQIG